MRVQVTAKNCEIRDDLRERAERGVRSLQRFDPRVSGAEILFEEVGRATRVEIVVSADRADPVVAKAEEEDFRKSLDITLQRLKRILRERREKSVDHRGPSLADALRDT
jgi:ribosomal subunit interface protein